MLKVNCQMLLQLSDFCERLKKKEPSSGTYFEGSHEKVREFIEENLQLTVDVKQIHGKVHCAPLVAYPFQSSGTIKLSNASP